MFENSENIKLDEILEELYHLRAENLILKQELATIKGMGMYEFANRYCTTEQLEEAGHELARSLGVGK